MTSNQATIPAIPTVTEAVVSTTTGKINAQSANLWDELIFNHGGQSAGTDGITYMLQVSTYPASIAVASRRMMSSQFTFLLAVATKGDSSQRFHDSSLKTLQNELGLMDSELHRDEFAWTTNFTMRTIGFTQSSEWEQVFKDIMAA